MKKIMYLIIVTLLTISCSVRENKSSTITSQVQQQTEDQAGIKPDVKWEVHTEIDENGNIVRYDSTYTWSNSYAKDDSTSTNMDSLKESFTKAFNKQFTTQWNRKFHSAFPNDSLKHFGQFPNDEFMKMWNEHFEQMGDMFLNMDSLKNRMFKQVFPDSSNSAKITAQKKSRFDI
ncbi:MAG: hypothetical protein HQ510_00860 [Candidatus Marinimicrobia bacterium]|nr:hypothetical protein [Candidatus Neomarinimicrobiota bacterium]